MKRSIPIFISFLALSSSGDARSGELHFSSSEMEWLTPASLEQKGTLGESTTLCRGQHPRPIGRASAADVKEKIDELKRFIEMKVEEAQIAGLSVGFSYRDTQWAEGFGFADIQRKKRATGRTSYRMASVTKTFTAVAILQLVEAGRVSLDAEVQEYLPAFPRKTHPVIIRDLLGHLSGVSHYRNCDDECHIREKKTTAESLAIFQGWELEAAPREKYVYTSYGYNLLGAVIEKVSGLSYGAYLQRFVFRPLSMKDSQMDYDKKKGAQWAKGYRKRKNALVPSEVIDLSSRFAGGGSRSTVLDMIRFGKGLLSGKLIEDTTLREMSRSMATHDGILTKYGMGAAVYPLAGRLVMAHSGGQPETTTLLFLYPHEGLVMAIACNVEDQWDLLYDIAAKTGEMILNDGIKRRGVQGVNGEHQFFSDGMMGIFGHGVARLKHQERFFLAESKSPQKLGAQNAKLIRGFAAVREILKAAQFAQDKQHAYEELDRARGPLMDEALGRVGAHMGRTIVGACGREQIERYHIEGPIPFFQDYIDICRAQDCPTAFLFDPSFQDRVRAYAEAWTMAYPDAMYSVRVDEQTDLPLLEETLQKIPGEALVKPDFSSALIKYGEKAYLAGEPKRAMELLRLGYGLYPMNPKMVLAFAEAHLLAGDFASAEKYVHEAFLIHRGEERLTPVRIKLRAMVLQRHGFRAEAHEMLRLGTSLHPEEPTLWDALGKSHFKRKRFVEALLSYQRAAALGLASPARQRRIEKLQRLQPQPAKDRAF